MVNGPSGIGPDAGLWPVQRHRVSAELGDGHRGQCDHDRLADRVPTLTLVRRLEIRCSSSRRDDACRRGQRVRPAHREQSPDRECEVPRSGVASVWFLVGAGELSRMPPRRRCTVRVASWVSAGWWVVMITVRPSTSRVSACTTSSSACTSSPAVGSSSSTSGESTSRARAMPTRWRCPPDRPVPPADSSVLSPSGSRSENSLTSAARRDRTGVYRQVAPPRQLSTQPGSGFAASDLQALAGLTGAELRPALNWECCPMRRRYQGSASEPRAPRCAWA